MPLSGVKILVVEDHPDSREVARRMLAFRGALVTVAADGAEALRKIAKDRPDLILCDLMMPHMDGYEVAQRVRRMPECAQVRLVALTAVADEMAYFRTWTVGYDAYLEKPITFEKLEAMAEGFLAGRLEQPPKPPRKGRRKSR